MAQHIQRRSIQARLRWSLRLINRILFATFSIVCLFFATTWFWAPNWLPLPWNDVQDFVVGADGSLYLLARIERVLRYDRQGDFVASYKTGPMILEGTGSDIHLAADVWGRIYVKIDDEVRVYSSDWREFENDRFKIIDRRGAFKRTFGKPLRLRERTWRLGNHGEILYEPGVKGYVPDRSVRPGELIFSAHRKGEERKTFETENGSTVERRGNTFARISTSGETEVVYRQAWFLWPLGMGSLLAWIVALLLFLFLEDQLKSD